MIHAGKTKDVPRGMTPSTWRCQGWGPELHPGGVRSGPWLRGKETDGCSCSLCDSWSVGIGSCGGFFFHLTDPCYYIISCPHNYRTGFGMSFVRRYDFLVVEIIVGLFVLCCVKRHSDRLTVTLLCRLIRCALRKLYLVNWKRCIWIVWLLYSHKYRLHR